MLYIQVKLTLITHGDTPPSGSTSARKDATPPLILHHLPFALFSPRLALIGRVTTEECNRAVLRQDDATGNVDKAAPGLTNPTTGAGEINARATAAAAATAAATTAVCRRPRQCTIITAYRNELLLSDFCVVMEFGLIRG